MIPTSVRSARLAPAVLAAVTFLAAVPFALGRFPFLLDFVVGPGWEPFETRLYGLRPPAYGGSLPLLGVLSLLPPSLAAKALVPGVLVVAAVAGYATLPGPPWARLYGAILLVVNPFVHARIVAGQWAVVWGLAMLPVALFAVTRYLEAPRPRRLVLAVGAITLLGFSAHLLYASVVLLGAVTLVRFAEQRDLRVLGRALTVALVAVPVNAYWLVPAVVADGGPLARLSTADLDAFAPAIGSGAPLYETASMHGFWRDATVYARDLAPAVSLVFVFVVFLAVYGALARHDGDRGYVVRGLVLSAAVALLLGTGASGPVAPAFRWLADVVPFFAGMRDADKFVALLVVAYAYLGALGAAELLDVLAGFDRRLAARALVGALVVLAPLALAFPMVTGYAGQATVGDYPEEWYETATHLDDEDAHGVLFLPWHQYQDLPWLDGPSRRAATPARAFFSTPVAQGDNIELGAVYSTSANPVSRSVESLFGLGPDGGPPNAAAAGARLAELDVSHVVLAKGTDWRAYEPVLTDAPDLRLVRENDHLRVYRNDHPVSRAYATDAPDTGPGGDREPLEAVQRSPAAVRVEGSALPYTAVAQPQIAAGPGWHYDGEPPVARRGGARPVYASADDGATLQYAPFYGLYLPSYALSLLSLAALAGYGLLVGTGPPAWRRWPATAPRRSGR